VGFMSEEANAPVEQAVDSEVENLKAEVEAMRKKNAELLDETKKAKAKANASPDVDVQALLDFKAKAEQVELEQKGKYGEAKQALEQQYREKSTTDKQKIEELESKLRELELISPASQALAEVVHDPNLVLQNFLPKDKIDLQEGKPVVVDGYERIPVADWAKTKLKEQAPYLLKQQVPQGGGAPAGRTTSAAVPSGTKNPFESESFNITEQMRLYRTDKDLYDRLQSAAKR
tara:strand:+ start:8935 stop:9630 length:696 start_codon:yes stop_codon:yes gene_type:complete